MYTFGTHFLDCFFHFCWILDHLLLDASPIDWGTNYGPSINQHSSHDKSLLLVATGTPLGICTILYNESIPYNVDVLTGYTND
jgi:hypothetical protein